MSSLEEAAQKRLDIRQAESIAAEKQASISAVTDGANEVVQATKPLAKSTDIDSLIAQVKEVQLAAMLGANKPSVVLTDQTDLGDRMAELGKNLNATVAKLDSSAVDTKQLQALKELKTTIDAFSKSMAKGSDSEHKALLAAISGIDLSPVINLPEPKVTIQPQKLDLKPLQDTIKEYFQPPEVDDKVDLDCYRAQDITDDGGLQYVGFVNPEGGWYIIENDVKANKMRYVFGTSGYAKAFKKAAAYQYLLLNEAIDATT